jgi:hypothetical protein
MSTAIEPYGEPEAWDDDDDEDDAIDSLLLGGNDENEALDKEVRGAVPLLACPPSLLRLLLGEQASDVWAQLSTVHPLCQDIQSTCLPVRSAHAMWLAHTNMRLCCACCVRPPLVGWQPHSLCCVEVLQN